MDEAGVNSEVGGPRDRVWVLERRRVDRRLGVATYRHEWIDGRACPALQAAIEALGRLPPIAMAGAATAPTGWDSDTPEVTLIGRRRAAAPAICCSGAIWRGPTPRGGGRAARNSTPAGDRSGRTCPAPTTCGRVWDPFRRRLR